MGNIDSGYTEIKGYGSCEAEGRLVQHPSGDKISILGTGLFHLQTDFLYEEPLNQKPSEFIRDGYQYKVHVNRLTEYCMSNINIALNKEHNNLMCEIKNREPVITGFGNAILGMNDHKVFMVHDKYATAFPHYNAIIEGIYREYTCNSDEIESFLPTMTYEDTNQTVYLDKCIRDEDLIVASRIIWDTSSPNYKNSTIAEFLMKNETGSYDQTPIRIENVDFSLDSTRISALGIKYNSSYSKYYVVVGFAREGAVYFAKYDKNDITQTVGTYRIKEGVDDIAFGATIAVSNNYMVVGAPEYYEASGYTNGAFFVYDLTYHESPSLRSLIKLEVNNITNAYIGSKPVVIDEEERYLVTTLSVYPQVTDSMEGILVYNFNGENIGHIGLPLETGSGDERIKFGSSIILQNGLLVVAYPMSSGGKVFFYDIEYNEEDGTATCTHLLSTDCYYYLPDESINREGFGASIDMNKNLLYVSSLDFEDTGSGVYHRQASVSIIDVIYLFRENNVKIKDKYFK